MTHLEQYWARLVQATPQLADNKAKMTITVASFRKQITKAHHNGFQCGMRTAKQLENLGGSAEPDSFQSSLDAMRKKKS